MMSTVPEKLYDIEKYFADCLEGLSEYPYHLYKNDSDIQKEIEHRIENGYRNRELPSKVSMDINSTYY